MNAFVDQCSLVLWNALNWTRSPKGAGAQTPFVPRGSPLWKGENLHLLAASLLLLCSRPGAVSLVLLSQFDLSEALNPNTFPSLIFSNHSTMPTANQRAGDRDTDWRDGPWYRDGEIDWYNTSSLKVKVGK